MATSKTLTPTNVTIQIPAMTDAPDQSVNSNCIDKLGDAVNTLNSQITTRFPVFTTSVYSQAIGASTTADITIDASGGVYLVLLTRVDRRKTGVYVVDAAGTSELVEGGATVSISSTTLSIVNGNNYTISATIYRLY